MLNPKKYNFAYGFLKPEYPFKLMIRAHPSPRKGIIKIGDAISFNKLFYLYGLRTLLKCEPSQWKLVDKCKDNFKGSIDSQSAWKCEPNENCL